MAAESTSSEAGMSGNICFLVWFLITWGFCWGRFVVEKNSLKVTSPDTLKGVYECAIGNFGIPQYGGTMVGFVAYPKTNRKACRSFKEFGISFKSKPGGFPTFILVDRGGDSVQLFIYNAHVVFYFLFPCAPVVDRQCTPSLSG